MALEDRKLLAAYVENAVPVAVAPSLNLGFGASGVPVTGARVSIGTGFNAAQDRLSFTPQSGIMGSYDQVTGVLTLTGSSSVFTYQNVLRTVTYENISNDPTTATRSIQFTIDNSLRSASTGHYYEFVSASRSSWTQARDDASRRSLFGLQGYLATVTSSAESTFVTSKLPSSQTGTAWIGGSDEASEGSWRWVTGPEGLEEGRQGRLFWRQFGSSGSPVGGAYTNWNTSKGEPNGQSAGEDYIQVLNDNVDGPDGSWNDQQNTGDSVSSSYFILGYLVEYGGLPTDAGLQSTVTVEAVNDAPENAVLGAQAVNQDTDLAVTGVQVSDVDAKSGAVQVTLAVASGRLTLRTDVAGGLEAAAVTGNGTGTVALTGTLTQVNATLAATNGLVYRGNANFAGADNLTITTNDQGNTGTGGALSDTDTVGITVRDTAAPAITAPADFSVEATGPAGAAVSFNVSATDLVDGAVSATATPSSGSTFPIGTTTVIVTATDAAGNTGTTQFAVTVLDTTAPAISVPADITVDATGPAGAVVNFNASATDLVDGAVSVTATPASGSTFPVGTTTVIVTAIDAAGNTGTTQFAVTVLDFVPPAIPTIAAPASVIANEDVDRAIPGISVGDPDGGNLTVTLAVGRGRLALGSTTGLSVAGNGTGSVTLSGSIADLNAALAGLVYRGNLNFGGADSLKITANDGSQSVTSSVAITVRSTAQQASGIRAQVTALRDSHSLSRNQATVLSAWLNLKGTPLDIVQVTGFAVTVGVYRALGLLTSAEANSLLAPVGDLLVGVARR